MKKKTTKKASKRKLRGATVEAGGPSPSQLIDARIKELSDAEDGMSWRGEMLARARAIIMQAAPGVVEEWKWGVPVWSSAGCGIICTGETYKSVVKLTFAKGASLPDPSRLFNSSLEGNTRRAIDFREGDDINAKGLKALVRSAAALNASQTVTPVARPARSRKRSPRE